MTQKFSSNFYWLATPIFKGARSYHSTGQPSPKAYPNKVLHILNTSMKRLAPKQKEMLAKDPGVVLDGRSELAAGQVLEMMSCRNFQTGMGVALELPINRSMLEPRKRVQQRKKYMKFCPQLVSDLCQLTQ